MFAICVGIYFLRSLMSQQLCNTVARMLKLLAWDQGLADSSPPPRLRNIDFKQNTRIYVSDI